MLLVLTTNAKGSKKLNSWKKNSYFECEIAGRIARSKSMFSVIT